MSFRRAKQAATDHRAWRQFVDANGELIRSIGIPDAMTETQDHWWHFLEHGYHPDDAARFHSGKLNHERAVLLVELLVRYCDFRGDRNTAGWAVFPNPNYLELLQSRVEAGG